MLALVIVSINLVLAEDNLTKSYACLRQKIADQGGYSSLSNEEKVFSLLALSSNATEQLLLQSSILSSLQDGCLLGSTGSCSLKLTGMGLLALALTGGDTSQLDSWLSNQTNVDQNTEWYLEIDSGIASCKIYSGNDEKGIITIGADKKISGSLSGCFSQNFGGPFDGYWLKIAPSCYDANITTICNSTFVTSLIYKKSDSVVYYIPNTAKSAGAGGQTNEKVNAYCFGTTCSDYEGSLWAATALKQENRDIEKFKPYLYTAYPNYLALLPSAFLFKISNSGTQAYYKTELVNKRDPMGKWWQPSTASERNYYTSLAVWVLGKDTTEASAARDYLINEQLRASTTGCLSDSISETAFALFAVSGLGPVPVIPVNINITLPNQTTTLSTAYPTIGVTVKTGGIARDCNYKIDNGNLVNLSSSSGTIWTGSTNITPAPSSYFSQHSINVYCKNIAGQDKTASKEFNVSITPLNISITKPKLTDPAITSQTTTISAEINTDSRACTFSFDDKSKRYNMTDSSYHLWSGQGIIPVSIFPDRGKHSVTVYCLDTLGNEITKKEEFNVNLEIPDPPTNGSLGITIDFPVNTVRYERLSLLQSVNLTTTNITSICAYSLDSGSDISMTIINESNPLKWSAPLNVTSEGNHNITAICTDSNGNSAQKIISFIFNTTSTTQKSCAGNGYCLSSSDCLTKTEDGLKLDAFTCPYSVSAPKICCSENIIVSSPTTGTCYDEGGIICGDDEECEGTLIDASNTNNCCDTTCKPAGNVIASCTSKGGTCKGSCTSSETSGSYFCDSGECCIPNSAPASKSYWWVWVLLILIVIIAVGIVFREKLKEYYYRIIKKEKGSATGQGAQGRPSFGPGPGMPPAGMGMPRRIIPGMNRPGMIPQRGMPTRPSMPSARPFPKDKELNETLAKLKNMGK